MWSSVVGGKGGAERALHRLVGIGDRGSVEIQGEQQQPSKVV